MNHASSTLGHPDGCSPADDKLPDWTLGRDGIVYQRCRSCAACWYFQRPFCPGCGAIDPLLQQASGHGIVHSVATIHRAPSEEMRPYAPYIMVLIDIDEGFRMMAHGAPDLHIGDRVCAGYRTIAARLMPYFELEKT